MKKGHVWIKNSKGEYLISKRLGTKKTFPHMWEPVGGAACKGEDSLHTALKETKEKVAWVSSGKIANLFKKGKFVPTLEYFFTKIDK